MREILDRLNARIQAARIRGDKKDEIEATKELQALLEGAGTTVWGR